MVDYKHKQISFHMPPSGLSNYFSPGRHENTYELHLHTVSYALHT